MVMRTKIMVLHECPKCHTHVRITENIDENDKVEALVEIIDKPQKSTKPSKTKGA